VVGRSAREGPLGGDDGDPGAPTTYLEDVDGDPLGGDAGGPGVPTTYLEDVDGGAPGRRCRRSRSFHHQSKKRRRWALWEAMSKI
jgi:hypothetical protein